LRRIRLERRFHFFPGTNLSRSRAAERNFFRCRFPLALPFFRVGQ
jgi:hypothetical protein